MPDAPLTLIEIVQRYWWLGLIAVMIFVIILLFKKIKSNTKEYHNEIEKHIKTVNEELKYNPCSYNYIVYRNKIGNDKPLGKILGYYHDMFKLSDFETPYGVKDQTISDMRHLTQLEISQLRIALGVDKEEVKKEVLFDFVTFSLKTNSFRIPLVNYRFWFGEAKVYTIYKEDYTKDNFTNYIVLNDGIDFKYKNGRFISTSRGEVAINLFTLSELYRTMHDHTVNAMGYQQLKFAEIKTENAILLDLKQKDAEIEEKKRKRMIEAS